MTDRAAGGFRHRMRVRYAECDAQGVVFNAHYLGYVDQGLTELWRERFGGYATMTDRGVDVVVAESHLRFRAPARFDEEIDLTVSVATLGTTSMVLDTQLRRAADDTLLCEVQTRYVWIEIGTRAKTAIPDWARSRLLPQPGGDATYPSQGGGK